MGTSSAIDTMGCGASAACHAEQEVNGSLLQQATNEWNQHADGAAVLSKVTTNLELARARGQDKDGGKDLVVLLACGAYNPLHWGHLEILKLAKYGVEASGATVIGGFMSPAFDEYVKRKGDSTGESWAGAVDRLDMVQLATIDSDWLCPYAWEALQTVMHPASAVPAAPALSQQGTAHAPSIRMWGRSTRSSEEWE